MSDLTSYKQALLNYALKPLGLSFGATDASLSPYEACMPMVEKPALSLMRSLTALEKNAGTEQSACLMTDLDNYLFGTVKAQDDITAYLQDYLSHPALADVSNRRTFDRWSGLLRIALSGVPGRRGEATVSQYHEFKLMSAVVHATKGDPSAPIALIAGDFPGIQKIIYAIDVKGAAKNVRGRSFFLQLLTDAVVLRLLDDLELPLTNALYIAGGKFLMLAPAETTTDAQISTLQDDLNSRLLTHFGGEMRFITASVTMPASDFRSSATFFKRQQSLQNSLSRAKTQPFQTVIADDPHQLFAPTFDEDIRRRDAGEDAPVNRDVFGKIATALANRKRQQSSLVFSRDALNGEEKYSRFLRELCGFGCMIQPSTHVKNQASDYVFRLNDMDYDVTKEVGFRLLAVHTPLVSQTDLDYWNSQREQGQDDGQDDEEDSIGLNDIRNFELLAVQQGRKDNRFKRYGVLRMDVDSLGEIFAEKVGGGKATITQTIAASESMSLFFEAYVPQICRQLEDEKDRLDSLYIIYGGGDDLFVVGEWDLLPRLAQNIRDKFHDFTDGQATISAGIVLQTMRFPFYQAADLALEALDEQAKSQPGKNAISFLNQALSWPDWEHVAIQQANLVSIADVIKSDTVTRNVLRVYGQWWEEVERNREKNGKTDTETPIYFGPYKWRAVYQIARLKEQIEKKLKNDKDEGTIKRTLSQIDNVKSSLLQPEKIRFAGLAARWAELERRTKDEEKGDEDGDGESTR